MSAMTFDTLKFMRTLETAGVPTVQAEAFSKAFKDASGEAELVTKRDMQQMMSDMKFELLKWIVGLALAQFGLMVGILLKMA
jgi:hypothetical protein